MPISYLEELGRANLPISVTDPDLIRKVVLLRTALLINAKLDRANAEAPPYSAVVYEITPTGWATLGHLGYLGSRS